MRISVVVGNPKQRSRTLLVATAVATRIAEATCSPSPFVIDLIDYADVMFQWPNETLAGLNASVAASDVLVVGSPTYKGTYTGLLKSFLDRYPSNALSGVTAVPVMTASSPLHGMTIELGLRPLLVELGASVPGRGLFFPISQIAELENVLDKWSSAEFDPTPIWNGERAGRRL